METPITDLISFEQQIPNSQQRIHNNQQGIPNNQQRTPNNQQRIPNNMPPLESFDTMCPLAKVNEPVGSGRLYAPDKFTMERLEGALHMQKNASDVINLQIMVNIKTRLNVKGDKATLAELSRVNRLERLLDILSKMLKIEDTLLDWFKALSGGVPGDVNNQLSKSVTYIEKSSRSMAKTWAPSIKPKALAKTFQIEEYIVPVEAAPVLGAAPGGAPGTSKSLIMGPPRSPTNDKPEINAIIEGIISTKAAISLQQATSRIQKILEPPHQKMHIAITQCERERQAKQMKQVLRNMKSFDPFERKIAHLDRDMHRCLTAVQQVVEIVHQNESSISGKQLTLSKYDVKALLLKFPQPYVLEEDLSD